MSTRALYSKMDAQLFSIVDRFVERGAAVKLRTITVLRAAQLMHNPDFFAAVVRRRSNGSDARIAQHAAVQAVRDGATTNAAVAEAVGEASVLAELRRQRPNMERAWASRLTRAHGFVQRTVTQGKVVAQQDAARIANQIDRVTEAVMRFNVPRSMVVNADESGIVQAGVSKKVLAKKGAKNVAVNGVDTKEQITNFEAFNANGVPLKRMLIFPGKTTKVHPSIVYDNILYAHSPTHWQVRKAKCAFLATAFLTIVADD